MKKRDAIPGTAAAPLLHWLLVVCGLAVITATRISMHTDDPCELGPLWVGALFGTGVGQFLAKHRLRPWLATFIVANAMWMMPLLFLPIGSFFINARISWAEVEIALMAFAPAAACGYASLTERGALPAFWFPAMLWVLAILDGGGETALAHAQGFLLLAALAGLLLAFLGARETRRVALWQARATVRLGTERRQVVLREAPLRFLGRIGWVGTLGAATLMITAWIAPHLWQQEKTERHTAKTQTSKGQVPSATGSAAPAEACCADSMAAEVQTTRVREYLQVRRTREQTTAESVASRCVACRDGVPIQVRASGSSPAVASGIGGDRAPTSDGVGVAGNGASTYGAVTGPISTTSPATTPAAPRASASAAPSAPPKVAFTAAPALPPPPPPAPEPAPAPVVVKASSTVPSGPVAVSVGPVKAIAAIAPPRGAIAPSPHDETNPFGWLLSLSLASLVVHVGQRPLRRMLFLRHLRSPLWPETVDQRVSNLWQWMLVGLRDAGFHVVPGEQPQELARRVGLEGMKTCATVLERARHGVRVDAADLEAMTQAAGSVYDHARARAGWLARAISWLRWPLV
ncbi:Hypothetical protein A7982_04588 [Minicystis rosea]|nr:Hypothetical protein A7982_04588 [Minicystis rosea]